MASRLAILGFVVAGIVGFAFMLHRLFSGFQHQMAALFIR